MISKPSVNWTDWAVLLPFKMHNLGFIFKFRWTFGRFMHNVTISKK